MTYYSLMTMTYYSLMTMTYYSLMTMTYYSLMSNVVWMMLLIKFSMNSTLQSEKFEPMILCLDCIAKFMSNS